MTPRALSRVLTNELSGTQDAASQQEWLYPNSVLMMHKALELPRSPAVSSPLTGYILAETLVVKQFMNFKRPYQSLPST